MTHGCITIRLAGEKRQVLLHTHHSGYLIPDIVRETPAFLCKHRWEFLTKIHFRRGWRKKSEVIPDVSHLAFDDGVFWPPCVAALLIAQHPWMLEPIPPVFARSMAKWSGADHPYSLILHEKGKQWVLFDEEGRPTVFHPVQMMVDWLWAEYQNTKRKR